MERLFGVKSNSTGKLTRSSTPRASEAQRGRYAYAATISHKLTVFMKKKIKEGSLHEANVKTKRACNLCISCFHTIYCRPTSAVMKAAFHVSQ